MFSHIQNEKEIQVLESFLANFSETDYADHLRFLLANHYLFAQENELAKQHFTKLKERNSFVFFTEAKEELLKLEKQN